MLGDNMLDRVAVRSLHMCVQADIVGIALSSSNIHAVLPKVSAISRTFIHR